MNGSALKIGVLFISLMWGCPLKALDWVGLCENINDEASRNQCLCEKGGPIISGKYQKCLRDQDCHLFPSRCGGWVTFNQLYTKEFSYHTEDPEILAGSDTKPRVICFRKKCIKVEKD